MAHVVSKGIPRKWLPHITVKAKGWKTAYHYYFFKYHLQFLRNKFYNQFQNTPLSLHSERIKYELDYSKFVLLLNQIWRSGLEMFKVQQLHIIDNNELKALF